MKIEKAIEWMEEAVQETTECFEQCSPALQEELIEQKEVFELAITALRSMPEAGEPLSLEQLKHMNGKPVWIERIEAPYDGKWFIVDYADTENPDKTLYTDSGVTYSEYGKYFIAYSYPPAHIDRSKWEAEWVPMTDDDGCVWFECSACQYDLDSMEEPNKFCPSCGKAMTEEAWAELERRVRE